MGDYATRRAGMLRHLSRPEFDGDTGFYLTVVCIILSYELPG